MRLSVLVVCGLATTAFAHPDKSLIRHEIRLRLPDFRRCYDDELAKHPKLEGKVVATFTILSTGKVADSRATGMPVVEDCVARVIRGITFPPNRKGSMFVSYPFVFQPR